MNEFKGPQQGVSHWRIILVAHLMVTAMLLAGCEARRNRKNADPFERTPAGITMILAYDGSGSFRDLNGPEGRAANHMQRAVQHLFESRVGKGQHDRLVVATLSATNTPLFYEGVASDFFEMYGDPSQLRRELLAKSDPRGSRLFDGISDAIQAAMTSPYFERGKTKLAVLVLSDMDDNVGDAGAKGRMLANLKEVADAGGFVGLSWLPQTEVRVWTDHLRSCGFPPSRMSVTSNVTLPELPNF